MITVKDAVKVLKTAKTISLSYASSAIPFSADDPLMMDAYGDYLVDDIRGFKEGYYELNIVLRPVRVGDC